jgi:hypothetical protein
MTIDLQSISVVTDEMPGTGGQVLRIELIAPDPARAKHDIGNLMGQINPFFYRINETYGTFLTLFHLTVTGPDGELYLEHVEDLELEHVMERGFSSEARWMIEGLGETPTPFVQPTRQTYPMPVDPARLSYPMPIEPTSHTYPIP